MQFTTEIMGYPLSFQSDNQSFSPTQVDAGTLAMLSAVEFSDNDKVLDLGCGYGVVGILAGKIIGGENVVMSDISEGSAALAKSNAAVNDVDGIKIVVSDAFSSIQDDDFTLILSNPPYHVDFSVPKRFIEQGYKRLKTGGKMYMVTKRKEWYKNKLISVFGGVKITEKDEYFIFMAEKISRAIQNTSLSLNGLYLIGVRFCLETG